MFLSIHHVAIICSDYERSKAFYIDILGFKVIAENYRQQSQSYKLDLSTDVGLQIELFYFPQSPERISYPEACGLRHLAFSVDSIEHVIAKLNGKGIKTEEVRVDEYTGKRFTFFQDPDKLPIELYEE